MIMHGAAVFKPWFFRETGHWKLKPRTPHIPFPLTTIVVSPPHSAGTKPTGSVDIIARNIAGSIGCGRQGKQGVVFRYRPAAGKVFFFYYEPKTYQKFFLIHTPGWSVKLGHELGHYGIRALCKEVMKTDRLSVKPHISVEVDRHHISLPWFEHFGARATRFRFATLYSHGQRAARGRRVRRQLPPRRIGKGDPIDLPSGHRPPLKLHFPPRASPLPARAAGLLAQTSLCTFQCACWQSRPQ